MRIWPSDAKPICLDRLFGFIIMPWWEFSTPVHWCRFNQTEKFGHHTPSPEKRWIKEYWIFKLNKMFKNQCSNTGCKLDVLLWTQSAPYLQSLVLQGRVCPKVWMHFKVAPTFPADYISTIYHCAANRLQLHHSHCVRIPGNMSQHVVQWLSRCTTVPSILLMASVCFLSHPPCSLYVWRYVMKPPGAFVWMVQPQNGRSGLWRQEVFLLHFTTGEVRSRSCREQCGRLTGSIDASQSHHMQLFYSHTKVQSHSHSSSHYLIRTRTVSVQRAETRISFHNGRIIIEIF